MAKYRSTKVSIIIPCYNEERFLPSLFESIRGLKTGNVRIEVILVDNGSSDRSFEIAREYNAMVFVKPGVKIAAVRNFGANHAKGDILAFLDADCLPQPGWLSEASKYFEEMNVGLFGSSPLFPIDGTWVQKAWCSKNLEGVNDVNFIGTANMFIKKNVFKKVNGFDENLATGEDYDICQRILKAGYRIVSDDQIAVEHLRSPKTLFERYKKEIWYGEEMLNILKIKPFYKPFWASLIFGCSFILIIACLILRNFGLFFQIGFFLFFSLPILSAASKVLKSKRYKYFVQLIILYFIYLFGRFSSILKSGKQIMTKIV